MKLLLTILLTLSTLTTYAIDMNIISQIESNNNPNAVSYKGAKYGRGKYQVSESALQDYNTHNRTQIAPEELFNSKTCHRVAKWYFNVRIPQMLRYYNKPVTVRNQLVAYNAGINYVVKNLPLPKETINYITFYIRLTKERKNK